jgi:branched-subunit amino acid aminotransferase/4-amino-4-deoxychorismate lyase
MKVFWCNGKWLTAADFPAAPLDRGAMLGLGLFETVLGEAGRAVFAERHLARLAVGCERLGWVPPGQEFGDLVAVMERLLQQEELGTGRARIRVTVTGGSGELADLAAGRDRLVWMMATPATAVPATLAVTIAPWPRNERGALAGLKCASYAENLVALDQARRAGFQETLFFNTAGELCEAATANVFLVTAGRLRTPPLAAGCLAGVTRGIVLELAARNDIDCAEATLGPAELAAADEVILTSAIRGPVAVSRVAGRTLPPPQLAGQLRTLWEAEVRQTILPCRIFEIPQSIDFQSRESNFRIGG